MRWLAILIAVTCQAAHAQSAADTVYAQCTGPAFERQARMQYEKLPCQASQTCEAFDLWRFAAGVEVTCFTKAVDICTIFDGADGCISGIVAALNKRTALLEAEYTDERARNALETAEDFEKRGLTRILDGDPNRSEPQCYDQGVVSEFEEIGVSEATVCAAYRALNANRVAYEVRQLTLRVEGDDG